MKYGATSVAVTVHPMHLRFSVTDNGPGIKFSDFLPFLLAPSSSSARITGGLSLASLAATSTVELRVSTPEFAGIKVVQASTCLESRTIPPNAAGTVLRKHGMRIEVWETFKNLPVRRRVELSRSPNDISHQVWLRIVPLALARPDVAITLRGHGEAILLRVVAARSLSLERVTAATGEEFASAVRVEQWRGRLKVTGFVGRRGAPHARMQLLAINGLPSRSQGLHGALKRSWRAIYSRAGGDASVRRFAMYVLNCHIPAVTRSAERQSRYDTEDSLVLQPRGEHDKDLENTPDTGNATCVLSTQFTSA